MNIHKIHSLRAPAFHGSVPFSWEHKPGISKIEKKQGQEPSQFLAMDVSKLPLPPCPPPTSSTESPEVVGHLLEIPLPPCTFQPPLRSNSKKAPKVDDPFLVALKECTKSVSEPSKDRKFGNIFSCKHSCGVREDSLVNFSSPVHHRYHHRHLRRHGERFPTTKLKEMRQKEPKMEARFLIHE